MTFLRDIARCTRESLALELNRPAAFWKGVFVGVWLWASYLISLSLYIIMVIIMEFIPHRVTGRN